MREWYFYVVIVESLVYTLPYFTLCNNLLLYTYPTTDFKFKNDTPNHILIQPVIDLTNYNLNFEIYGTSDNRTATTTKPVITSSIAPAPDLYVDDPTLPAGTIKQVEHRAYGARVVFDYTVTRNGETINSQKFVSNYRPWQAVYLKGVGQ